MAGFAKRIKDLDALGAKVVGASVDALNKAKEVAAEVSFPIGFGLTRETADKLGAWWGERRSNIEPAEFIIGADGTVLASTYSSGPIGRMNAEEVLTFLRYHEARRASK